MIKIHRRRPVVRVGERTMKITRVEHALITALGMMDNKVTPREVLLDVMCEGRVQIPADHDVLMTRMSRLKQKIGSERLRCRRQVGYILIGDVQFYG
jgi:DNA-binding response OmpR family regulator